MTKVMINVKFFTLLQDVIGGPPRINLPTENRYQVTAASDLADWDNRGVAAVLAG